MLWRQVVPPAPPRCTPLHCPPPPLTLRRRQLPQPFSSAISSTTRGSACMRGWGGEGSRGGGAVGG